MLVIIFYSALFTGILPSVLYQHRVHVAGSFATAITHRINNEFSKFSQREHLNHQWLVNSYFRQSVNLAIRCRERAGIGRIVDLEATRLFR